MVSKNEIFVTLKIKDFGAPKTRFSIAPKITRGDF